MKLESFFKSQSPLKYLLIIILSYIIYSKGKRYYNYHNYKSFGVAEIVKIDGQNTNTFAIYEFFINSQKYDGAIELGIKDNFAVLNRYFKVQYSSKNPEINDILLNKPIYDTLLIKKAGFVIKKKKEKRNQFHEL
jgi:hypothetical protein